MRWTPGKVVFAIGLLHQALGFAAASGAIDLGGGAGRNLLAEVARAGVVAAIEPDPARQILFWFLACGFLVLSLGWALDRWEAQTGTLPAAVGWQLLAFALGGGLLIPASGFWLVLAPAGWVLVRAQRARAGVPSASSKGGVPGLLRPPSPE